MYLFVVPVEISNIEKLLNGKNSIFLKCLLRIDTNAYICETH